MITRFRRALARALIGRLCPEAVELALAVKNADFTAPGCADVLRKLAGAALGAMGEADS